MKSPLLSLMIIASLTCCSTSVSDLVGSWSREVDEPALNLSGIETMEFHADSTFRAVNKMAFLYSDSIYRCSMAVIISQPGTWSMTGHNAANIHYSSAQFTADSVPGSFKLEVLTPAQESDTMPDFLRNSLLQGIADYYSSSYTAIDAIGGLTLQNIQTTPDSLSATIASKPVTWKKNL